MRIVKIVKALALMALCAAMLGADWYFGAGSFAGSNLANYFGPVSITGSQTNGTDSMNSVNVNGVIVPQTYGASGSNQTITCTATASNAVLSCTGVADFKVGQGIFIPHAGPAALNTSAPSAPTVTTVGATGSTTYAYKEVVADDWGGLSPASASAQVTNGNATPSQVNYSKVVGTNPSCAGQYCALVIYQQIGGVGNFNYYAVMPYISSGTGCGATCQNIDAEFPVPTNTGRFPATAPATTMAQDLATTITAINGNNITVATAPSTNSTSVTVLHDDTVAAQAWLNAVSASKTQGFIPNGTYNINAPSYWNGTAWTYVNPTSITFNPGFMLGYLHLYSNTDIRGASRAGVVFQSLGFQGTYHTVFTSVNPISTTTVPGALCDSNFHAALTSYPMNNVIRGSAQVVATTAANAANFNPGDRIWYGGGVIDSVVSCGVIGATDLNEVMSSNATTGIILLKYPVTRDYPYGTPGTANFMSNVTANTFSDIAMSDMTILSFAGGVMENSVVRFRMTRINMTQRPIDHNVLFGTGRDVTADDIIDVGGPAEEFSETNGFVLKNSTFFTDGVGPAAVYFSDGMDDIIIQNNHFISTDVFCGFKGGCDLIDAFILGFSGVSDVQILNNSLQGQWVIPVGPINFSANGATDPQYDSILIQGNDLGGTTTQWDFGIQNSGNNVRQIIKNNKIYINAGTSGNSAGITVETGLIQGNQIFFSANSEGASAGQGGIVGLEAHTDTEPLDIVDNVVSGASGNNGIYITGVGSNTGGVLVANNILNVGTGIANNSTSVIPRLQNNTNLGTYNSTNWAPSGEMLLGGTGASAASNAATNFMSLDAQTVNATETNVQMNAPRTGVIGQFRCHLGTTPGAATGWTFTLRDNAASPASGPTCTATAVATCSDLTHSAIVAAGDLLDIQIVPNSTPTASTVQCSIQFGT